MNLGSSSFVCWEAQRGTTPTLQCPNSLVLHLMQSPTLAVKPMERSRWRVARHRRLHRHGESVGPMEPHAADTDAMRSTELVCKPPLLFVFSFFTSNPPPQPFHQKTLTTTHHVFENIQLFCHLSRPGVYRRWDRDRDRDRI